MSGVKTRRQTAAATAPSTPKPAQKEDADAQVVITDTKEPAYVVSEYEKENIFLFYPNIIGYFRIVLAFASLYYMPLHPRTCSLLYSISCLLDALDGYAARAFSQSTRFGAVLDMVTDRCTTACLLVFLSSAWPRWALLFQGLISLDLASHYIHMYATLVMSGTEKSHKAVDKNRSWLLNIYYTNKTILFLLCLFNETFFIALYLLSFSSPTLSPSLLQVNSSGEGTAQLLQPGNPAVAPASALFASPYSAGALELARANKLDSTVPWIIAGISVVPMLVKQFINGVQLVSACRWLAEGDVEERRTTGLAKKKSN